MNTTETDYYASGENLKMDNLNGNRLSDVLNGILVFMKAFNDTLKEFSAWYQRNADAIDAYIVAFSEFGVWCKAIQKMSAQQIVFTDDLTIDLAKRIIASADVNSTILKYYLNDGEDRLHAIIVRCKEARQIEPFRVLYDEIIAAFCSKHYQLACVGLFSMLDGLLSEITSDTSTNFKRRVEKINNKLSEKVELDEVDKKLFGIYMSMGSFENTIFKNEDFKHSEPEGLNRHWVVHGRTRKQYSKLDCLKALLMLDAFLILDDASLQTPPNNMEQ